VEKYSVFVELILFHMQSPVNPYSDSTLSKTDQVAIMFNRIAFRYDLMNHLLSLGIDRRWRNRLRKILSAYHPKKILDLATGTADVAIELVKLHPEKIIAVDISNEMLQIAGEKIRKRGLDSLITLMNADSQQLPLPNEEFDAITVAFGVRNFEDLQKGLQEMFRLLKKGGVLAILEFSKPHTTPFKQLFNFYFKNICPLIGRWIAHDKKAYHYLVQSVQVFPSGKAFEEILNKTGFENTRCIPLSLGICSIYTAEKH
jgi:demethylmenaquinone methyltransferase / 2-methoxy-6-polyprenyl-1,4-benzoquinol methylase